MQRKGKGRKGKEKDKDSWHWTVLLLLLQRCRPPIQPVRQFDLPSSCLNIYHSTFSTSETIPILLIIPARIDRIALVD